MTHPWLDIAWFTIRTLGVGVLIYFMGRYLPRRSGGGLAAYDFVFFWMMGGLAVAPLYDLKIRFIDTLTAVATIYACHYILSGLAMANPRWASWISGKPISVIEKGVVQEQAMEQALLPVEMLMSELRTAGASRVSVVETATLETTGHISVVKKADYLPVTAGDINKAGKDHPLPLVVVADGKVISRNLHKLGFDDEWLSEQLNRAGALRPGDAFVAIWEGTEPIYWSPRR